MSTPEAAEVRAKSYEVILSRVASESIVIGGEEAATVEEARETAYQRAEGFLCHQCAKDLSLSDYLDDVVNVTALDDTVTEIDYAREAEEQEHAQIRLGAMEEVAAELARLSTGHPSGEVRAVLRDAATKIRYAHKHGGKVDLS